MRDIPFVGRRAELRVLRERFHCLRGDGPQLVLISAPAGGGKTTLVRRFFHHLGDGILTAEGRGWDNLAAVSYHALREAMRQLPLLHERVDAALRAFLASGDDGDSPPPHRLFPLMVEHLRRQSAHASICLFIDDLQWVDEGTFEWIDYALEKLKGIPLLCIGAYRSEEAGSLASLLKRRAGWYAKGLFGEIELGALSRDEVEQLVHQGLPDGDDGVAGAIWERSEGLPLLAAEEVRARAEGLGGSAGGAALIANRISALEDEERKLLSMAAVIGECFTVEPLAAALEQDPISTAEQLEAIRTTHALIKADDAGYRFAHSRFRVAVGRRRDEGSVCLCGHDRVSGRLYQ